MNPYRTLRAAILSLSLVVAGPAFIKAQPAVTATKDDNTPAATRKLPGDTIRYSTEIRNSGTQTANGVTFTDPDGPNVISDASSIQVSAVAVDDVYPATVWANVGINTATSSAFNVLANDLPGIKAGTPVTLGEVTLTASATSAQGGVVTLVTSGADKGKFSYDPPAGYTGPDSFTYQISTGVATAAANLTGTVRLTVGGPVIWFVDAGGAAGNGKLSSPFNTLAAAQAASAANHSIFLFQSPTSYAGGIVLKDGQKLIGQDSSSSLVALLGSGPPADSATLPAMADADVAIVKITSAASGVTAGAGNLVSGLTIGNTTNAAISGANFGTLIVSGVRIADTATRTGQALALSGGTLNGSFPTLTASGAVTGVSLTNVAGSVTISAGALSGLSGPDFVISGGSATVNYAGTIGNTAGRSVDIQNSSGTITFTGAITDNGTGILFSNNTGTVNFQGGIIANTGSNTALTANGGGNIRVTGTNTIGATTALSTTAISIANVNIAAGGLNFRSVRTSGGTSGIILNNTGSTAGLTITGTGDSSLGGNASGGSIQNTSSHGISLTSTLSPSFTNLNITNTGGSGIHGTLVTNFTFANGSISGSGDADGESNIAFNNNGLGGNNLSGTLSVTNSILSTARSSGIDAASDSGTISEAIITGNTITSSTSDVTSLGYGINLVGTGGPAATANLTKGTISNNTIRNFPSGGGIQVLYGNANTSGPAAICGVVGNASNVITITNNVARGQSALSRFGTSAITAAITSGNAGSRSQGNFNISNNGSAGEPIGHSSGSAIVVGCNLNANVAAVVNGNYIVAANSFAANGISGGLGGPGTGTFNLTANGNTIQQTDGNGILLVARGSSGTATFKVQNNNVAAPLGGSRPGIRIDSGNGTGNDTVFANISGNTSAGSLSSPGIGVRKEGTSATSFTFGIQGLSPSPATAAQVEASLEAQNPASAFGTGTYAAKRAMVISGSNFVTSNAAPLTFRGGGIETAAPLSRPEVLPPPVAPVPSTAATAIEVPIAPPDQDRNASLTQAQLDRMVDVAVHRWIAAGITPRQASLLREIRFETAGLTALRLGEAEPGVIRIDRTAGGYGWYVDASPLDDAEFANRAADTRSYTDAAAGPAGRIDLLTTLLHEMGHALGLDDTFLEQDRDSLMYGYLTKGERRTPAANQAKDAVPHHHDGRHFLTAPIVIGNLPAGKSVTVTYDVTINPAITVAQVSSQGVVSGTNFSNVSTDDVAGATPTSPGAADPTVTLIGSPPVFTSPDSTAFLVGGSGGFQFAATGIPAPSFSTASTLPAGVTLTSAGLLSGTPAVGSGGVYSLTVSAANSVTPDASQTFTLTVNETPRFTSAASTSFTVGSSGTFNIASAGYPLNATVSQTGTLPAGLSFTTAANGTATISGTPEATAAGIYTINLSASNGLPAAGSQTLTLTVNKPPAITSPAVATFLVGVPASFTITTAAGYPTATDITLAGSLPASLTFTDNDDGTATISGTPTLAQAGTYPLTITASNGISPDATQSLNLSVTNDAPLITDIANQSTNPNQPAATLGFTVGDNATAPAALTLSAASSNPTLVPVANIVFGGNGASRTVMVTPAANQTGVSTISITVKDEDGNATTDTFVLTVNPLPVVGASLVTTSLGGADGRVTRGEIATYQMSVRLSPGATANLRIVDAVPAGMAYVPGSVVLSSAGFSGSVSGPSASPVAGSAYLDGTDVRFDFDPITVAGATASTFSFTFQAVALDVAGNDGLLPGITTLTHTATADTTAAHTGALAATGSPAVEFRDPELAIQQVFNPGTAEPGQESTVTWALSHTAASQSGAYDVKASSTLPANLVTIPDSLSAANGATDLSSLFTLGASSVDTIGTLNLPPGETITITFKVTPVAGTTPGTSISNVANLSYSNYPGDRTATAGFNPNPDLTTDQEKTSTASDTDALTVPGPDYTVTTTATGITVTDIANNSDVLQISQAAAGTLRFEAAGRKFSINGATNILGNSGNLSLSGITQVTVDTGNGSDSIDVGALNSLPGLMFGGRGAALNLNGNMTFIASSNFTASVASVQVADGVNINLGGSNLFLNTDTISWGTSGGFSNVNLAGLRPLTGGRAINLGTSLPDALSLTNTALQRFAATNLAIGRNTSGALTVSAAINRTVLTNLTLVSGADILIAQPINTAGGSLNLSSGGRVRISNSGADVTAGAVTLGSNFAATLNGNTADTQYDQFKLAGSIDLTGTGLTLSGSYTALTGNSFTLIDNDGTDPVAGTFTGLAEGASISFNGVPLKISYAGGDGNDVVLRSNVSPSDITLTSSSIPENSPVNSLVGVLGSVDADTADSHSYVLVTGSGSNDNASFAITSGNELRLVPVADFETKSSYSIRIRSTDGNGGLFEKVFTISIGNVNEAPNDIVLSAAIVLENNALDTVIGTLSASDPEPADSKTYTLVSGTGGADNASFAIDGSQLVIRNAADFETKPGYSVRIQVADGGGLTSAKAFNITVTDVNEAPFIAAIAPRSLPINAPVQTINFSGITAGAGENQALTVTASSSNTALIPNPVVAYASPSATGSLAFTPATNQSGTATLTVTVTDNGGTANGGVNSIQTTFTVTVSGGVFITTANAGDDAADESGDSGLVTFTRTDAGGVLAVAFGIDASSTAGASDFSLTGPGVSYDPGSRTGTVSFAAGAATATVVVTALPETVQIAEIDETVKLNIVADAAYGIGTPASATITISANGTVVANTADAGEGSLRQAILNANAKPDVDRITFEGPIFSDATPDVITLTGDVIEIESDMSIAGKGAGVLAISGNASSSVFDIREGKVNIAGLSVTGGRANSGAGLFIRDPAIVNILDCAFTGNQADAGGGAIFTAGKLTVVGSTFQGNSAATGGAITSATSNSPAGTYTRLVHSTLSGNSATTGSGGYYNAGGLSQIIGCTITANSSGTAGCVATSGNSTTTTQVLNSIIAGNAGGPDVGTVGGSLQRFTSNGGNLIGNVGSITTFTATGDQSGTSTAPLDPKLGPLADNGGPTSTHAILAGSSALNGGLADNVPPDFLDVDGDLDVAEPIPYDQRGSGFNRTVGSAPDSGAFELGKTFSIVALDSDKAEGSTAGTTPFTFTISRLGDTVGDATVSYTVSGRGANPVSAADFAGTLPAGLFTIPDGEASATLTLGVSADSLVESDEGFTVTLSAPAAPYVIELASAEGSITDDDAATLSIASVNGGAELTPAPTNGRFRVSQSSASASATTVGYVVTGTAVSGTDFTALSGSVTIPANTTTADIVVSVLNDFTVEPAETVILTLSSVSSGNSRVTVGSSASASLEILDSAPAAILVNSNTPTGAVVNTAFLGNLVAKVTDAQGNALQGAPVTFTPPGSGASGSFTLPATVFTNSAGLATAPTFTANTIAGSYTVSAATPGVAGSAGFALINYPAPASTFAITVPATAIAGAPVSFGVSARDPFGNLNTSYSGPIRFSSTDATATLPITSTINNGAGNFTATFGNGGSHTLSVRDNTNANIRATSAPIAVSSRADLIVNAASPPDTINAGAEVAYQFVVTNAGPSQAAAVEFINSLPAGTRFVSFTAPAGWSSTTPVVGAGGTISSSISSLPPGSWIFSLTLKVDYLPDETSLSNTATVSSATVDQNPGNESFTVLTMVSAIPEIAVYAGADDTAPAITDGAALVYPFGSTTAGTPLFRTFTVKNTGTGPLALDVITPPAGFSLPTAFIPQTLAPTGSLSFSLRYDAPVVGTSTGQVVISSNDANETQFEFPVSGTRSNVAPVANPRSLILNEDSPTGVILSGSDADGDSLTYTITTAPAHGSLSGSIPNLTYTPEANYNGPDSFAFKVNDGSIDSAASATVSITVNAVNDAPVAVPTGIPNVVQTAPGIATTFDLANHFTDVESASSALVYAVVQDPADSFFSITRTGSSVTLTGVAPGRASLTVVASDPENGFGTATFQFTVKAVPELANGGIPDTELSPASSGEGIPLGSFFLDRDGDPLGYTLVVNSAPTQVAASINGPVLNLEPLGAGTATLIIRATDSDGNFVEDTFTVTVKDPIPTLEVPTPGTTPHLNRQTGLYEVSVTATNLNRFEVPGFRLRASGLPAGITLRNSTGPAGTFAPYLDVITRTAPGQSVVIVLEFYSVTRNFDGFNPIITAEPLPADVTDVGTGAGLNITLIRPLADGGMLLEFTSIAGKNYQIEYSSDLTTWKKSLVPIKAGGNRVQWIDRGAPYTDAPPDTVPQRFYRVSQID